MWGAPPLWLTLVLGHGRGLTQATRTETYPPVPIRLLSVPPPPGAPLYIARCTASRTTSGSEGSGCHQAQRTGGGEPQRGVLPSRCLSGALTFLTHIPESICGQKESTFLTQLDYRSPVRSDERDGGGEPALRGVGLSSECSSSLLGSLHAQGRLCSADHRDTFWGRAV